MSYRSGGRGPRGRGVRQPTLSGHACCPAVAWGRSAQSPLPRRPVRLLSLQSMESLLAAVLRDGTLARVAHKRLQHCRRHHRLSPQPAHRRRAAADGSRKRKCARRATVDFAKRESAPVVNVLAQRYIKQGTVALTCELASYRDCGRVHDRPHGESQRPVLHRERLDGVKQYGPRSRPAVGAKDTRFAANSSTNTIAKTLDFTSNA
jgi:hypothetical protein